MAFCRSAESPARCACETAEDGAAGGGARMGGYCLLVYPTHSSLPATHYFPVRPSFAPSRPEEVIARVLVLTWSKPEGRGRRTDREGLPSVSVLCLLSSSSWLLHSVLCRRPSSVALIACKQAPTCHLLPVTVPSSVLRRPPSLFRRPSSLSRGRAAASGGGAAPCGATCGGCRCAARGTLGGRRRQP